MAQSLPEILPTHTVQDEIDAEIRDEKLLSNVLAHDKIRWIFHVILIGKQCKREFRSWVSFIFNFVSLKKG